MFCKKIAKAMLVGMLSVTAVLTCSFTAFAEEQTVDSGQTGHIKIVCEKDGENFPDVKCKLYLIGERDKYENTLHISPKFLDKDIDLKNITGDNYKEISLAVEKKVNNSVKPSFEYSTNSYGFLEEVVPQGVYFLEIESFKKDNKIWSAVPAVVEVNDFKTINEVMPKLDFKPEGNKTDGNKDDHIPQTGGNLSRTAGWGLIVLAVISLCGFIYAKSEKDKQE